MSEPNKVLAKYDIRGIQSYVFRTKKLKEIRAVSDLPEKIVFRSLVEAASRKFDKTKYQMKTELDLWDEVDTSGFVYRTDVYEKLKKKLRKHEPLDADERGLLIHAREEINGARKAVEEKMKEQETANLEQLKTAGIEVLDKAGGNAFVVFQSMELYREISRAMAKYILEQTYSLKLCYACVECTENFMEDYNKLNQALGTLKSSMPEVTHMGAFPICRQDHVTGFPFSTKTELTRESELKQRILSERMPDAEVHDIDSYVRQKGEDSKIAVIHIDGNNMGNRISQILAGATYETAQDVFASIRVRNAFHEVCEEMEQVVEEYRKANGAEDKPLIYAIIQAGDDITYITQANIALSFTKLFLEKVSKKYMLKGSTNDRYLISACAGIAICHSHFPFIDAYDLAENLCASAKKRAKTDEYRGTEFDNERYIGNWIDFELCEHIRDVDVSENRKRYGTVGGDSKELLLRPYCVEHPNCPAQAPFDFKDFETNLVLLNKNDKSLLNRSRAKELRQAYMDGKNAVDYFHAAAKSRDYFREKFKEAGELYSGKYAVLYDAVEIMDQYVSLEGKGVAKE